MANIIKQLILLKKNINQADITYNLLLSVFIFWLLNIKL